MKKRTVWGWIYGITALWFAVIMVYSNFIKIPPGRSAETGSNPSNLVHENVYFIHEDHMGRPVLLTQYEDTDGGGYDKDGNGNYYWKASYKPFGQVYDDFNSVGIKVGTGDTAITWTPSFRFPGQYADPELGDALFYNRFRFYMPSIGRYTSADPLGLYGTNNLFAYVGNNPVIDTDIEGLYDWGTHKNKTKEWGKEIGICNINSIAGANADVDILHPSIGSNRGEWHFPSSNIVQQGIKKCGCDPKEFGRQLHRVMDHYAHVRKSWKGPGDMPPDWQPPKPYRHPIGPRSPDLFSPDSSDWGKIDAAMEIELKNLLREYKEKCCTQ